jgi:hypothetical protein
MRAMGVVVVALAVSASTGGAQGAPSARLPDAAVCDMSARVLLMHVVDSSGRAVADAALTVRRARTGALVDHVEATGDGSYRILEDGAMRDLRREGEPFDVTFVSGARRRRVRVRIGMDASGCHVQFVTLPAKVVM